MNIFTDSIEWIEAKADPRVKGWPLMGSAVPVLTILSMYLYFVKVWGPRMMKDRPPFQIEKLIIGYNVIMVLLSGFFFFVAGSLTYLPGGSYSLVCEPVDYSEREPGTTILWLGWWFLLLKLVELLDTVFFVLRKKFTHISILHVTHHSLVAWGVWIGLKFGGGGHSSFFPIINCGVHMIMYSYYCLAALGPRVRPFLWWKKYLTIVQMTQFVVALVHACLPLVVDCGYQPFFAYTLMGHALLFWIMFYNFYHKSYNKRPDNNNCQPLIPSTHTPCHLHDCHRQVIRSQLASDPQHDRKLD